MRMGATVEECELPSFYELLDRFSLFDSSASSGCDVQIGKNGSLFCKCEGCIRWSDFVEGRDPSDIEVKYEVFTREHVAGLACYLRYVCGPDLVLTCFHFVSFLETDKASSSLFL